MGVEVRIEGLTKSFGRQNIWADVSFTLPAGQISVLLGPSGTGKSVFLKTLVGLLKPERGSIWIHDRDITRLSERELYKVRRLFGVLFQDGALFGSMSLYDNIAFPLREHTKKSEREIKAIVGEKMEMVGLIGSEQKLPGEISGGMRKRAGLARALVLDPEIVLFDEPDSGLDPVRTAYLNQLIVDLNQQIGATFLIVTHDINTARTVPDNIGLLYRRHLAMFGPREMLLSSQEPVVRQFLNAQRQGPIGMAEEKDTSELEAEAAAGMELAVAAARSRCSSRRPTAIAGSPSAARGSGCSSTASTRRQDRSPATRSSTRRPRPRRPGARPPRSPPPPGAAARPPGSGPGRTHTDPVRPPAQQTAPAEHTDPAQTGTRPRPRRRSTARWRPGRALEHRRHRRDPARAAEPP